MAKQLKNRDLEKLARKWQKRLRLQDWAITVRFQRVQKFEDMHTAATCETHPPTKVAKIRIRAACDATPKRGWPLCDDDPEQCLVHELLHLHFDPYMSKDRESAEYIAQEQTIELLAWALVNLDHKRKK